MRPTRRTLRKIKALVVRPNGGHENARSSPEFYWSTWTWTALANASGHRPAPEFHEVCSAHTEYRRPPHSSNGRVHWRFVNRLQWESPPLFRAVIPGGRVWGGEGAVITPDGELLADLSLWEGLDPAQHRFFAEPPREPDQYQGELISIAAPRGDSYFHWMFDVLPRLEILRRSGYPVTDGRHLLVNPLRYPFQEESLSLLGLCRERVRETSDDTYLEVERLVVPSFPGNSGEIPHWVCQFLRQMVESREPTSGTGDSPRRLYVSRGEVRRRRVTNEAEVCAMLAGYGFEVVDPSGMTLVEQARLFAAADVVVAPHGGALTNLVFCRPGTSIVEIFSPEYVNVCYWTLANQVELKYHYVLGRSDPLEERAGVPAFLPRPGTERHAPGTGNRAIIVDVDELSRTVRSICDA